MARKKYYACSEKKGRVSFSIVVATKDPTAKAYGRKFGYCTGPFFQKKKAENYIRRMGGRT